MMTNNPQAALPSSIDYITDGNPAVQGFCFPGDWSQPKNGQGLEDFYAEEIQLRSLEMLEDDVLLRLLKTPCMGIGITARYDHPDEACHSYRIQYEPKVDWTFRHESTKGSGKAVVGWLKLKTALRWGIFVRKKAAERRAQLVELE